MNELEIIEGNKLIAEFMGYGYDAKYKNWLIRDWENKKLNNIPAEKWMIYPPLKYHASWDKLMPVVEKIESLGFTVRMNCTAFMISDERILGHEESINAVNETGTKIGNCFKSVTHFIKWHNGNKITP